MIDAAPLDWNAFAAFMTGLAALVGAAGPVADWITHRKSLRELNQHVAHDLEVAQFWGEWLKQQRQACDDAAYEAARSRAANALAGLPTFPERALALSQRSPFSSALLLYRPDRAVAWLPRAAFYATALLAAATLATPFYDMAVQEESEGNLVWTLLYVAVLAAVALLFRAIALRLERSR